jgi:hypothetical protein
MLGPTVALFGVALLVAPAATAGCAALAAPTPSPSSLTTSQADQEASLPLPPAAATPDILCLGLAGLPGPPQAAPLAGGVVADPTGTGGFVTVRTAHLIAQTRAAFPGGRWACWSPRPGTRSEHPLGRACDVTFGNAIGVFPNDDQVAAGWRMTTWLQVHAETLGVEYLIWQGRIWSLARRIEGWRIYNGGGIHDPTSPTGGHYDHLHITVRGRPDDRVLG